jgi:hypothetical protein
MCPQVFKVFVLARVTPAALRQLLNSTNAASSSSSTAGTSKPSMTASGKSPTATAAAATAAGTAGAKAAAAAQPLDEGDALQAAGAAVGYEVPSDEVLGASNIYSTAEACLLAWMSHHTAKAFPNLVRLVGVPEASRNTHSRCCSISKHGTPG